jgi:beta-1,4-mannosyl-glycoprotein beta-1,4-N-acetylglucosaminyltransferase
MKKKFISFGSNNNYNQINDLNIFDEIDLYTAEDLIKDVSFWKQHGDFILNNKKEFGYCIWKSYLIKKTMDKLNDGDIILYLDNNYKIVLDEKEYLLQYLDIVKEKKILYHYEKNKDSLDIIYNKMDLIHILNMTDNKLIFDEQYEDGIQLIYVCKETRKLTNTIYNYACVYHNIDDTPSILPNHHMFKNHRHNQSLFSLLVKKNNLYSNVNINKCIYKTINKKIIDCFIFYNELKMLKFRLKELNDCVDYFILVECVKTFCNNDKELFFENNKKEFSQYLHKIIHIIVKDNIPISSNAWDREYYQRRCIDIGIKKLNLNANDIIIISDIDEIPDINTLIQLKNSNDFKGTYILEQDMYFYNLNCKMIDKWYLAKIFNYGSYCNDPQLYRNNNNNPIIKNGGWHLSYFGDVKYIIEKIRNFSHQEFNNDYMLDPNRILKQIKNNNDLYERKDCNFVFIDLDNNNYLPNNYKNLL